MTYLFYGDIGHEPRLEPVEPDPAPVCPICGSDEGDTYYIDIFGEIRGCNAPGCVEAVDAIDYADAHGF